MYGLELDIGQLFEFERPNQKCTSETVGCR